jgi:hypothetical protein
MSFQIKALQQANGESPFADLLGALEGMTWH